MQYRNIDKQALKENGYTVLAKISIVGTDTVFTEDDYIVDWDYEDYRYVPNNGFIGQFVERILDGNLQNISDGIILEDTEINLKLGIKNALDNDTITWYDYGNFLITNVEKTDTTGNYRFESADYTKKFNIPFKDYVEVEGQIIPVPFPMLAVELMDFTCFQAGVIPDYPEADMCSYYIVPEEGLNPGNYYFEVYEDGTKYINFTTTSYLGKNSVLLFIPGENKLIQKFVGYSPDHVLVVNRTELTFTKKTTHTGSLLEQRNSGYIDFTNNDFVIESNQYDSEDTCRKVMQDIAKLAYSWVRIGEDNKVHIDFTPKSTSDIDQYDQLTTDEYYVSKKSDLAFGPVNKVLIGMSDVEGENMYKTSQDYTEETECAIKIYDNNLTNTDELRAIALYGAERLFGLQYTPIEINSVGHPWLDGDELIKLTNVDNEVIYTYPFNRKIHYAGYIEGVIGAEASTTQNTKYEYKSDIISNVKRTAIIVDKQEQTITALAENVDENSSNISQMQIDLNGIDLRVQSVETTEVTGVTNEYAVNDDASNPPAQSSSDWSTTKPTRGEGEYIWARIKTTYKSGNVTYSNPVNTTGDKGDTGGAGPTGPTGDDGKGIVSVTELYYVSNSSTAPAKPTAHVTVSSLAGYNQWNLQCPPYVNTGQSQTSYIYFFTCSEILYTDNTYGWTNVTQNQGLAIANQNAYDATNTATSASTTANSAFDTVNNLQIGARNILRDTKEFNNTNVESTENGYLRSRGVPTTDEPYDDFTVVMRTGTGGVLGEWLVTNCEPGETYTLSFWIKGDKAPRCYFYGPNGCIKVAKVITQNGTSTPGDGNTDAYPAGGVPYSPDKWQRVWVTWILSDTAGTTSDKWVLIRNDNNGTIYIAGPKLEKGNKSTDWSPAPEDTDTTISVLNNYVDTNVQNLQNQIDGAIQFWNGANIPTLNNYPANQWTTEAERTNHQADIYTVIQDVSGELKQGKSYRFDKVNGTWLWIELTDNELSAVQALASSKAKVYVTTPTVPYNIGDLWLNNNKLYRCKTAKDASGSYSSSDWELATDYTNDTVANQALSVANAAEKKVYHNCSSSGGTAGYFYFARCVITQAYANKPVTFSIYQRNGYKSTIDFEFANVNGTDPDLRRFNKTGTAEVYIVKADTSTWDLYVKKTESYDHATFTEFNMGGYDSKFTWTWKDTTVTTLPTGYKAALNGDDIISGTQTAQTYTWTGAAAFPQLVDGQNILYFLPYNSGGTAVSYPIQNVTAGTTGSNTGVVLNLTLSGGGTTGNIPVYYRGTERLTTHYSYGSVIRMTYRSPYILNQSNTQQYSVDKAWVCDANYNSDTYDRIRFNQAITAGEAISAGQLLVKVGTSFKKLVTGLAFDVTQPILYAGSNMNNGATGNNNYLSRPDVNLRNVVSGITLTNKETCYLVGTLSGKTFTTKSSNMLTTTIPTTEDGYYYMSLGYMYSTYQMILCPEHPLFKFVDGEFKSLNQVGYDAQVNLDNLEIGGRNLLENSSVNLNNETNWTHPGTTTLTIYNDGGYMDYPYFNYISDLTSASSRTFLDNTSVHDKIKDNDTITISGYYRNHSSNANQIQVWIRFDSNGQYRNITTTFDLNTTEEWTYFETTGTIPTVPVDTNYPRFQIAFLQGQSHNVDFCALKVEKGEKATDWTPAPEDVDQSINDAITEIGNQLSNYVTTTTYDADWQNRKDEIYSYVNVNYTTTTDFGTYQETMQTALSQKADATTISATATQIVSDAISGIQDTVSNIEETFTFDTNGLTIARGGNTMYLQLQNDRLSFRTDGTDDGERAYMTSTEFVLKQLQSFQIGNFKFEVRTNGSLDFKKV